MPDPRGAWKIPGKAGHPFQGFAVPILQDIQSKGYTNSTGPALFVQVVDCPPFRGRERDTRVSTEVDR
jgi:hypothetical protein